MCRHQKQHENKYNDINNLIALWEEKLVVY